jgi:Zn-dependent protease
MLDFDLEQMLFQASIWALPVIIAITMHEAAHAWVAMLLGDNTARDLGRVTLNPIPHIDRFGTIVLPILCLVLRFPFVFGYATPVPVSVGQLENPRRDMMLVAAAGPAANLLLAVISAVLLHTAPLMPDVVGVWWWETLQRSVILNLVLAVFNLLPIPPLDGGRIAVGMLPWALAIRLARVERAGIVVVVGLLFLLPYLANLLGFDFNPVATVIWVPVRWLMDVILTVTGHV